MEQYIFAALAAVIALTVHEYSHGYAAYKLGDPTAKNFGRLTLNPMRHIDPFGTLCMILFCFGWARPVPIDPRYFRKPKRDFAVTALAGPLSNLILSFFSAGVYLLAFALLKGVTFESALWLNVARNSLLFLYVFHSLNLGFAIFNLIPIPPLDGSRLLSAFLPQKYYFGLMRYERYIYFFLLGWLFIGKFVYSLLMRIPEIAGNAILASVFKILSLSQLLSTLMGWLSELIFAFWKLIPFLA